MLANEEQFALVEKLLNDNGTIAKFERESGKIKGRMMITVVDIPEELNIRGKNENMLFGFDCSFDFYNCSIGIALHTDTKEAVGGLWITPQVEDAEPPAREWIEFFIKTLMQNIDEDGSFGCPIYSLLADEGDLTIVPTA